MAEQSAEVKRSGRAVTGTVVSNRMEKSITVLIERRVQHPRRFGCPACCRSIGVWLPLVLVLRCFRWVFRSVCPFRNGNSAYACWSPP